jgi:Tfp pilus assembly protein PilX
MTNRKTSIKSNQEGIVSIVVTVILMLIMTLIVLAMSQNSSREQRQALDRQLSDQAFYSAESGINDVSYYLYKYPNMAIKAEKCGEFETNVSAAATAAGDPPVTLNGNVDSTGVNRYTCALYNKAPLSIEYQKLGISESKVVPIQAVDAAGSPVIVKKLQISWSDSADPNGAITGDCSFNSGSPVLPSSCGYGGVRAELINASNTREAMSKLSFIAYLLPNATTGSSISVVGKNYPENQGVINSVDCDGPPAPRRCTTTIDDINLASFFLHVRSLYRPTDLSISAYNDSGQLLLKNSQITIDVTGKASDVLRRVQVRVPAQAQYTYPEFGIQTKDSICKLIGVTPNNAQAVSSNGNSCPID